MRVTVFGTGYVGLVTGTCLAEVGHQVVCVDIDRAKVEGLRQGVIPIYEPGLDALIAAAHAEGRISATTGLSGELDNCDIALVCVGTPSAADGGHNMNNIIEVTRAIAAAPGSGSSPRARTASPRWVRASSPATKSPIRRHSISGPRSTESRSRTATPA